MDVGGCTFCALAVDTFSKLLFTLTGNMMEMRVSFYFFARITSIFFISVVKPEFSP